MKTLGIIAIVIRKMAAEDWALDHVLSDPGQPRGVHLQPRKTAPDGRGSYLLILKPGLSPGGL